MMEEDKRILEIRSRIRGNGVFAAGTRVRMTNQDSPHYGRIGKIDFNLPVIQSSPSVYIIVFTNGHGALAHEDEFELV